MEPLTGEELEQKILSQDDERLFAVYESMKRGMTVERLHELTGIDEWFLNKLLHLLTLERRMQGELFTEELHMEAKQYGFPDRVIKEMTGLTRAETYPGLLPYGGHLQRRICRQHTILLQFLRRGR